MNYGATLHASDFWMGLQDASAYAGVGFDDLVEAITYQDVRASTTHPARPGDWMVRMSEVDLWVSARACA